jgi:hypothetical protein
MAVIAMAVIAVAVIAVAVIAYERRGLGPTNDRLAADI